MAGSSGKALEVRHKVAGRSGKALEVRHEVAGYTLLQKFPQEERYGLCDQLRRSVISIPSNIAEGLGRATNKDKGHFIQIAFGSLMEVMAQVDIAHDLDYIATEDFEHIEKIIEEETKLLKGLINHFK